MSVDSSKRYIGFHCSIVEFGTINESSRQGPISSIYVSLWCLFFDPHLLTTQQPNIRVPTKENHQIRHANCSKRVIKCAKNYSMLTLGPVVARWQQQMSLLIGKVHLFPKFTTNGKKTHPTHNNLTRCNILQLRPFASPHTRQQLP